MSRDVFIYGDDIIVPTDEAPSVSDALHLFGLKVNQRKSFWTGKFRESCGVDAFDGHDVTPTYARHEFPTDRRHAEAVVSWVAFANQMYLKGYWSTAREVRQRIEKCVGKIPFLGDNAAGLSWVTYSNVTEHKRWNQELMRFENRTLVLVPVRRDDPLEGDSALAKCFRVIGHSMSIASDHLLRSVARGRLALKSRWVSA